MTKDYCTGWMEGTWAHCCKAHDLAYEQLIDRGVADVELQQCVDATGNPIIAGLMFVAVSLFGWMFYRRKREIRFSLPRRGP